MHRVTHVADFAEIEAAFLTRVQAVVWCSAATIDRHGRPRTRIVHPIWEGAMGWITTRRRSPKVAQLAANPAIALAYIGEPFQPFYVECRAAISDDVATKQRIWALCNAYPEPFGFDPARVWGAADDPENAVLRLTPWRIELNTFTENPETIIWEQTL